MSAKIRADSVVEEAFRIGFTHWFDYLRFFLVPALIGIALIAGFIFAAVDWPAIMALKGTTTEPDIESLLRIPVGSLICGYMICILIMLLLCAGPAASFYRLAALGENRRGWFGLRFDGPARNLILAYVVLALIHLTVFVVGFVAAMVVTGTTDLTSLNDILKAAAADEKGELSRSESMALAKGMTPLLMALAFSYVPAIYLGIKLAPFPAGAAIENRLPLGDVFYRSFGNWWSILFSFILYVLGVIVLLVIAEIGASAFSFGGLMLLENESALRIVGGVTLAVGVIIRIFVQLFVSASGMALEATIYRRLVS